MRLFKSNIYAFSILIALILLGGFIRFYKLNTILPGFNQDEAVNGYDAYSIAHTLKDHHANFLPPMLESFDDWASPAITYITVPFVKVFGLSIFSTRMPVAVLGTLTIWLFYILGFLLTKKPFFSLIAALLIACSGILFHYSHWAIPPSIVPFFVTLILILMLLTISSKNRLRYIIFLSLASGITTYTYPTQKLFIPLILIIFSAVFFKELRKGLLILWILYILCVAPILYLSLKDMKYNTRYQQLSLKHVAKEEGGYALAFSKRYFIYLNPLYLFGWGDPDIRFQPPGTTIIDSSLIFLYLYGLLFASYQFGSLKKNTPVDPNFFLCLFLFWLVSPIPPSLTKDPTHLLRFLHIIPIVYCFIFIGIYALYLNIKSEATKKIYISCIILLCFVGFYSYLNIYFHAYPQQIKKGFQYGVPEIMTYLIKNENKFNSVIVDDSINKPYIYYLFFSQYNPKKLTREAISVQIFGKYSFRDVNQIPTDHAKLIFSIKENGEVFYKIFENANRTWIVKRMYE